MRGHSGQRLQLCHTTRQRNRRQHGRNPYLPVQLSNLRLVVELGSQKLVSCCCSPSHAHCESGRDPVTKKSPPWVVNFTPWFTGLKLQADAFPLTNPTSSKASARSFLQLTPASRVPSTLRFSMPTRPSSPTSRCSMRISVNFSQCWCAEVSLTSTVIISPFCTKVNSISWHKFKFSQKKIA